jgi:hypothetical protein
MLIKVENKDGYKTSNPFYYYTEDANGKQYLFSEFQLAVAGERADKNKEDFPKINNSTKNRLCFCFGFALGAALVYIINIII